MDWTILQGGLCGEGHVQSGQVGFPLLLNKTRKGSRTLEVLSMLCVASPNPHTSWGTFWKTLMNMRMSQHFWLHQNLWFDASGTEARRQWVLRFWPMGSAPSGIQTTNRSSVAPKTGGFTLVGGVGLGHRDLMGCIPTLY